MGGDFKFGNAETWYKNMDKLMKYVAVNVNKF